MKKFLAIYMGTPPAQANSRWTQMTDEQRQDATQKGMEAWGAWMGKYQEVILDAGGPLGKTKQASHDGITDITNAMTGYVIFHAESHQDAAEMFKNHAHFTFFPGDSVEIMEILPMPGQ